MVVTVYAVFGGAGAGVLVVGLCVLLVDLYRPLYPTADGPPPPNPPSDPDSSDEDELEEEEEMRDHETIEEAERARHARVLEKQRRLRERSGPPPRIEPKPKPE